MVTTALALRESLAQERVGLAHSVSYIIYTWFTYKNKREREKKSSLYTTTQLTFRCHWSEGQNKTKQKSCGPKIIILVFW